MLRCAVLSALIGLSAPSLAAGTLTLFASGEDLATDGFNAPKLTKDGWTLHFTSILVTFDQITAWQTDPPFMADKPEISGLALPIGGSFAVDLVDVGEDGRVALATIDAAPGHYNALSWAMVPGVDGYSLVLDGVARKDGQEVAFTLRASDSIAHTCGEYLGAARKGFVTEGAGADLEITLHLDHFFGRADKGENDEMNLVAPGFAPFVAGGVYDISLNGLHLGHVGEGHCHVAVF